MNKKIKKIILFAVLLLVFIIVLSTIAIINYKNAPKKAENTVAIYLSTKYNPKYGDYDEFLSFKKVYSTLAVKNGQYLVELSGSADTRKNYDSSFYAKVKIQPFSNKVKIEKLTFDDRKIK